MAHAEPMKTVRIPETLHNRAAKLRGTELKDLGLQRARRGPWSYEGYRLDSVTRIVEKALAFGLDEMDRRLKEKNKTA